MMIYTFSKRRAMNKALRTRYAKHIFEEDNGNVVPRMRTRSLPEGIEVIANKSMLEVASYRYREAYGLPLPIFIETGDMIKYWEINYVDCSSEQSINQVRELMCRTRIYAEVL